MKIIEVINVGCNKIGDFAEMINKEIVKGWQPYGNVFMDGCMFTILMVKYDEGKFEVRRLPKDE